eukprot:SAG31_NODE_916_length_11047_cov_3.507033_11_plen_41_part_00
MLQEEAMFLAQSETTETGPVLMPPWSAWTGSSLAVRVARP